MDQIFATESDKFINELAAVITSFQTGRLDAKGYISIQIDTIPIREEDWLMKHFLKSYLIKSQKPKIYPIMDINMGFQLVCSGTVRSGKIRRMAWSADKL